MNLRYLLVPIALVALVVVAVGLTAPWAAPADPLDSEQAYPTGAGSDHINFTALSADGADVSQTPRQYWDSYAITATEPPDRKRVEGEYYINATTGEIIADRWNDATVYRNESTYAFVQPADSIPTEREREEFESDPAFVYDNVSDAYYRYDPRYGDLAPTNIGRHTRILESYTWQAVSTTTHHGVPVITYRVTGTRADAPDVPSAVNGTLRLGVEDGIVYAYDLTVADDGTPYRYTYDVHPAPFPAHEWVETARALAESR